MSPDDLEGSVPPAASSGSAEGNDSTQQARQALLQRPQLSIRARIVVVFVLLSILWSGITAAAVVFLSVFESKVGFLENAGSYAFEIEEARRNEKNYFLYGTNLPEALASVALARGHLHRNEEQIRSVVGDGTYQDMDGSLQRYQGLLERLVEVGEATAGNGAERRRIEVELRTEGAQLVNDAQQMVDGERLAVASMLHTSMVVAVGFLSIMLLAVVLFGGFILRSVVQPLNRFMDYVARIGAGNYEPIRPARKYRDEFSRLALAFNQMLAEIVSRQDQLVRSGRMAAIGTLTSGIAHELNNPLNNIGLTVEAMLDGFDSYTGDQRRRMLEQAYTQVERASTTVRNLLDFTREDRSAFTDLQIGDVIESALRLVSNEAMIAGVESRVVVGDDLPDLRGNPHDLQQVLLNLLLNGIQAMPEGGVLEVSTATEAGGRLRIDVTDEGVGIPAERLDEIFDPFFTTKEVGEGTGLGLSVSQSIVEKHGGSITVESEVGKGTTISVHLPAAEPDGP